jgi:flagellar biosynthesis/type III secretory pathway protein FliH
MSDLQCGYRHDAPLAWSALFEAEPGHTFIDLMATESDPPCTNSDSVQTPDGHEDDASCLQSDVPVAVDELAKIKSDMSAALALIKASVATLSAARLEMPEISGLLNHVVMRLVEDIIDTQITLAPELIAARIASGLTALGDAVGSYHLKMHPDDLALVGDQLAETDIKLQADPGLIRGTVQFVSAETVLEDRLTARMAKLREKLDLPPA